jgi:two-component system, sensor histidine kinase and response regulator
MLSSTALQGHAERCRELGIPIYLTKPVGQKQLKQALLTVLSKRVVKSAAPQRVSLPIQHTTQEVKVLLAEDNPVNQRLAVALLQRHGYIVTVAKSGFEALNLFRQETFDVILMDCQMPEMDGLQATAKIRQLEQGCESHVPIIAVTAHATKQCRDECLSAGMDGYVSKPMKAQELLAAIASVTHKCLPAVQEYLCS